MDDLRQRQTNGNDKDKTGRDMDHALSVFGVTELIKDALMTKRGLSNVWIKGEVSDCKYHTNGCVYFTLFDRYSKLNCNLTYWNKAKALNFRLEDGQSIYVKGSINLYEKEGYYQFQPIRIELVGAGDYYLQIEMLKQKLAEEGLFDFEIKKPIPQFPKKIGLVTSYTGSALQDILKVAKQRNPFVQLILYPAKVEGNGAPESVVRGIRALDQMGLDTIIVARGGGADSGFVTFDTEIVCRAIYEAKTPIISGTGHEDYNTLADYAADLRASTPSDAIGLATPDVMATLRHIRQEKQILDSSMRSKFSNYSVRLTNCHAKLSSNNPELKVNARKAKYQYLVDRMEMAMERKEKNAFHKYQMLVTKLDALSPTAKLVRGFGYIEREDAPILSVEEVQVGDKIKTTIHDGTFISVVEEVELLT